MFDLVAAWLVILIVFAVLLMFWRALHLLFDLISYWHRSIRQARARGSAEEPPTTEGTGSFSEWLSLSSRHF